MNFFTKLFNIKTEEEKSSESRMPEIGKSIKWIDVVSHVFRVVEFDRAGSIIEKNGKVKSKSAINPYGYLLIESPAYDSRLKMPIVHRDDFLLASSVYDDDNVFETIKRNELLITYIPQNKSKDGLAGITHAIHYVIVPANTIETYYQKNLIPEKIFDSFTWEGEIKVGVNLNPKW